MMRNLANLLQHARILIPAFDHLSASTSCSQGAWSSAHVYVRHARTAARLGTHPCPYQVQVEITGFEPRYLHAAGNVIQDLFLINFAPKARSVAPAARTTAPVCGVSMAAEKRSIPVDWKRSRFTLIRGPHIDKTGMEQFETRRYKKVVSASSNSADEVHWMLEHLKLYEFTGVQLQVSVTGRTYLTPTAAIGDDVLQQHRSDIAGYLRPAAAVAAAERAARSSSLGQWETELRTTLETLRGSLLAGLKKRRETLKAADWYQAWHNKNKASFATVRMEQPGTAAASSEVSGSGSGAAAAGGGLEDEQRQEAASLLAAIDASLLSLRFDALERHAGFPFHFATFVPGSGQLPAAAWMHAVLKYGQFRQRLAQCTEEAQLLQAYSTYTLFAHTLLYSLFRMWVQQTVSGAKPFLALPSKAEAEAFMNSLKPAVQGAAARP